MLTGAWTTPAVRSLTVRPMSPELAEAPVTTVGETVVVPINRRHTVGVVIADHDGVRYHPVVDLERLAWCAVTATGVAAAAVVAARRARNRPVIRTVTMGPGGWLSLKGGALSPPPRPARRRPWWARLLRARRLVVD